MKLLLLGLLLLFSSRVLSQQLLFNSGKDTIYVDKKDTLIRIPFEIKRHAVNAKLQLTILVTGGTAEAGRDFVFRDAARDYTDTIVISNIIRGRGSLDLFVADATSSVQTIQLKTIIHENGAQETGRATLVLAPAPKKASVVTPPAKQPEADTLVIRRYRDNRLSVYDSSGKRAKVCLAKWCLLKRKKAISVYETFITKMSDSTFRIVVVSADYERFIGTITVNNNNEIVDDGILLLNETSPAPFIKARNIFLVERRNAGETTQKDDIKSIHKFLINKSH